MYYRTSMDPERRESTKCESWRWREDQDSTVLVDEQVQEESPQGIYSFLINFTLLLYKFCN